MTDGEAIDLIFAAGFSTATAITDLSGRGVRDGFVRTAVERLGGTVKLQSRPGLGTIVSLILPFSLMMTRVMTVEVAGQAFGLPLDTVVETTIVARDMIVPIGSGRAFVLRDRTIPLVDVADTLGLARDVSGQPVAKVVVVSAAGQIGELEVDRLGERLDVMLKPMEGLLGGMGGRRNDASGRRARLVVGPGRQFGTALTERRIAELTQRLRAWRARLESADPAADLANGERSGARFIIPGSPEWPTQLDQLGPRRPLGLWLHGSADLRFSCLRSIAVVGARAATAYGVHVAAQFAVGFSDSGWTVVSGGAFGIDGAAHRGSLAADSPTVVVLACGVDVSYPTGHHELFAAARDQGVVVSECPPGVHPTRARFLIRNRLIAALSRGTVVVEAALRSGALNTAGHALSLQRHLAVVPGPITSAMSAGCHRLLRERKAVCVTSPEEVIELVGAIGDDLAPQTRGPVVPRDTLSETTSRVLDAIPTRGAAGPASIAVAAGVSLDTALSALGGLAAAGYIERVAKGWRTRKTPSRTYVKADETAPPRQYPSDLTDDDDLPPSPDDP